MLFSHPDDVEQRLINPAMVASVTVRRGWWMSADTPPSEGEYDIEVNLHGVRLELRDLNDYKAARLLEALTGESVTLPQK